MKKTLLLSIVLVLTGLNSFAQWTWQNPLPQGNGLNSVCFTDTNTGYAVGGNGTILKTMNGGQTWTPLSSGTTAFLNSVSFTDVNTGYAVGSSGTILKTINGGATWAAESSGTTNGLSSVYFPDTNTGYAVGDSGTILKTMNGGATWSRLSSGTTNNLSSGFFTDANTDYVVGDGGTILKTINGGGVVGISQKRQTNSLKIYPNPVTERITIELSESEIKINGTVSVYGITCQELIKQKVQGSKVELNVSSLSAGIYFIRLVNNEKIEIGKFVKN